METLPLEQQTLLNTINNGIQISHLILDSIQHIDPSYNIQEIAKLLDLAEQIGYIEHTGDWDPYLDIQLKTLSGIQIISGTRESLDTLTQGQTSIGTESGYYQFNVEGEYISLHTAELGGDSEISILIPISDITKITCYR